MEIKGMLFPGKEPEFSIGNLEAMENQVTKITDENGQPTNGQEYTMTPGEEEIAKGLDKYFEELEHVCEHHWVYKGEYWNNGIRPAERQNSYYCDKCLKEKFVNTDEWHSKAS
jgi:hypothetical protein